MGECRGQLVGETLILLTQKYRHANYCSYIEMRFVRHRQTRVGRLSAGVVVWGDRHGCRSSAVAPWMARRHVPTPRRRSRRNSCEAGAGRQRRMVSPFAETKGGDRQGETDLGSAASAVGATRCEVRHQQARYPTQCLANKLAPTRYRIPAVYPGTALPPQLWHNTCSPSVTHQRTPRIVTDYWHGEERRR